MKCKSLKRLLGIASSIAIIGTIAIVPSISLASSNTDEPSLQYKAHVQSYGWDKTYQIAGSNGENLAIKNPSEKNVAGTLGKSKRMEALEINFKAPEGAKLKYRAHVQSYGWMNWTTADNKDKTAAIGTTGESKRIEALQIVVEGLNNYIVKYRAHVQGYGWLDWVTAGNSIENSTPIKGVNYAGTMGESKRMEAFEIMVIPLNKVEEKVEDSAEMEEEPDPETDIEKQEQEDEIVETQPNEEAMEPIVEVEPQIEVTEEHKHSYTPWVTVEQATCITCGKEERTCQTCKQVESRKIYPNPNAHSIQRAEYLDVTADCERYGQEHYICTRCNADFFNITQKVLGHSWAKEATVDVEATCTKDGVKSIHCTRPGCTKTKDVTVIPKGNHVWETKTVEATCTTSGYKAQVCKICGKENNVQITSKSLGHNFNQYVYNNDASCTKSGTETAHCTRCSATDTRLSSSHPIKNHQYITTKIISEPTCETSGQEIRTCKTCGKTQTVTIPALQHQYVITSMESNCTGSKSCKKCTRCSKEINVTSVTYGTGHTWDGIQCTKCHITKPTWTNKWSATYFMPAASTLCKKLNVTYNDLVKNHYSELSKLVAKLARDAGDEEAARMRYRIAWAVFYIADTTKCEGFDGKDFLCDCVITADHKFNRTAPAAKPGYVFDGWYKAGTEERITTNKTLTTTVDDMDKTFEARYKVAK